MTVHLSIGSYLNACKALSKMATSNPHDVTCVDCQSTWDWAFALRRAGRRVKGASGG